METGTWTAGLAFLVVAACAQAQGWGREGGCALLAELVEAGVHAAATQHELSSAALRGAMRGAQIDLSGRVASSTLGRQACGATVETVTRAFSRGMSALNVSVSWHLPPQPGNYCGKGDLRQCYPSGDPTAPAVPPDRLAFVHDAWNGIRRAVASQMPRGTGGRVSSFTEGSLADALSSSLQRSVAGPLHEAYTAGGVARRR